MGGPQEAADRERDHKGEARDSLRGRVEIEDRRRQDQQTAADEDRPERFEGSPAGRDSEEGCGAAAESARLLDSDESNPANILGIKRRALLEMKGVSTSAVAIEVGARFLTEAKQLDRSGQAVLTGHVMDDRGLLHPYWRVRSGDQIIFTDAADKSPRRIVRANKTPDSASVSIDLDAPPEGLDALLERLDVSLVGVIS